MTERLPASLAAVLRPALPGLGEEIVATIAREVEDYRRPLEGPFGHGVRTGVERALSRFVDDLEHPGEADAAAREAYMALGRGEMRVGRSLDALLSAYRLGARVAWERFVAVGRAAEVEPEVLFQLAGAIFTYIDRHLGRVGRGLRRRAVDGRRRARPPAPGARAAAGARRRGPPTSCGTWPSSRAGRGPPRSRRS